MNLQTGFRFNAIICNNGRILGFGVTCALYIMFEYILKQLPHIFLLR